MKIAVASDDGEKIRGHFGKCKMFRDDKIRSDNDKYSEIYIIKKWRDL